MPHADALGILRGMAPDRLDPDFVDAFEASLAPPQARTRSLTASLARRSG
jgi:HD-GYP domain-containing protein (c-di-GMP phosphodiesterase class II)